jgi:hypothetical protein
VDATHDVAKVLDAEHLARHRMPRHLLSAHRPQMLDPAQCGFVDRLLVSLSSSASGQSSVNGGKCRVHAPTHAHTCARTHTPSVCRQGRNTRGRQVISTQALLRYSASMGDACSAQNCTAVWPWQNSTA